MLEKINTVGIASTHAAIIVLRLKVARIGMSTPEARLSSICNVFKKAIQDLKKEIADKEKQVSALESRINKLQGQPNPDTALIQLLQEQLAALNNQLESDRAR